jgi:hypothetical protein
MFLSFFFCYRKQLQSFSKFAKMKCSHAFSSVIVNQETKTETKRNKQKRDETETKQDKAETKRNEANICISSFL